MHEKSFGGNAASGRQTATTAESDNQNPFKVPHDELIFTFKDNEARRKLQEKEQNK